jgi:hypothetical protein
MYHQQIGKAMRNHFMTVRVTKINTRELKTKKIEDFFVAHHDLQTLSKKMFFVWDGNHCL